MPETVSACCGSSDREMNETGMSFGDIGICPECRDHTEFIDLDEIDEMDYPEPVDRDRVNTLIANERLFVEVSR